MAGKKDRERHEYTTEEIDFLIENYPKYSGKELTKMFNEKFGHDFLITRLVGFMNRRKISSGRTGRFEKGQSPANKGIKMSPEQYEKCKATMFKKGDMPSKTHPIGTEVINSQGYVLIKNDERKWIRKQRLIYEQAHGKIPEGYRVIFADGDKYNFNLDNLVLVSNTELSQLNVRKLIFKGFAEGTKTGIIINKLTERSKELNAKK